MLAIIVFFIAGGLLLNRVDVEEGRRVARAADAGTSTTEAFRMWPGGGGPPSVTVYH